MYPHIDKLEKETGVTVVRLKPLKTFDYWMFEQEVIAKKGPNKGNVHRVGNGWPSPVRRWCTREKVTTMNKYLKTVPNVVSCVGFADDEQHRIGSISAKKIKWELRYPLVEYGVSESDAIKYCKTRGYNWDGLYDHFSRVSCFCCPLQKIGNLRKIRWHFPELWARMLDMDKRARGSSVGFRDYTTVHDLDRRFSCEDKQMEIDFKQPRLLRQAKG